MTDVLKLVFSWWAASLGNFNIEEWAALGSIFANAFLVLFAYLALNTWQYELRVVRQREIISRLIDKGAELSEFVRSLATTFLEASGNSNDILLLREKLKNLTLIAEV